MAFLCALSAGARAAAEPRSAASGTSESRPSDPWAGWRFVISDFIGEGTGRPGEATGGFSFAEELGGRALVRNSHADYPPVGGKPAYHHEDLMLVYREAGAADASALYLDNEGHVIHYTARLATGGDTLAFQSLPAPALPGYRFTYMKAGARALRFTFEIAPPARPDSFSVYLTGTARRRTSR